MSTLSRHHGWILRRDDEVRCTCQPVNPRHTDGGWQCLTPEQLNAWLATVPEEVPITMTAATRRRLAWLWLNWSQDQTAKRLSRRA